MSQYTIFYIIFDKQQADMQQIFNCVNGSGLQLCCILNILFDRLAILKIITDGQVLKKADIGRGESKA
jgi:hypothetical protein